MVFQKISNKVFAIVGHPARANVTAIVLPKKVVLVDCGIHLPAVNDARKEIEEISGRKVKEVILTHFHSDHTGALPTFSDCRIVSSNLLLKNLKQAGRKAPDGFMPTFPNVTFDEILESRDGNIRIMIKQTGGHTDCSSFVFCPEYKAIATGDNLWTKYYPWGGAHGSDPDIWIQTLEEYLTLDADYFIPGHGPVSGKNSVTRMLDYLTSVREAMKEAIADHMSAEEVIGAGGEVKYYASGEGHPHISTLRKWHKIWRTRVAR